MEVDPYDQRGAVLREVIAAPGASTRELATRLGVTDWTVDYHLRRLKRSGAVIAGSSGRLRAWYASSCGFCPVLRAAMPALRRPEALALVSAADETPATMRQLAARAGISVGAARWVTGTLKESFLLERSGRGRIALRDGASRCVSQARAGEPCTLWGKCIVSQAWLEAARGRASAEVTVRTQGKGEVPGGSTS